MFTELLFPPPPPLPPPPPPLPPPPSWTEKRGRFSLAALLFWWGKGKEKKREIVPICPRFKNGIRFLVFFPEKKENVRNSVLFPLFFVLLVSTRLRESLSSPPPPP